MIALTMRANQILHSPYPSLENFMVILETEVPVSKRENSAPLSYNVYIGDNTKRIFKHGTLPTFIKSKLAMIKSIPKEEWNAYNNDELFNELDCYLPQNHTQNNPEFKKIGWCVSDSIYVIIMSEEELSELKGIRIDTREKSQSKSKTNS
tara:strand:+ start:496 stop:945 length:450 start_codon:yes stop_codon:yes gene_type:complete